MPRRLTALVTTAVLLVAFAVPAQAAGPRSDHERILAFWTPERMATAIPRDFVRGPGGDFQPRPKPDNPGGGNGGGNGGGGGSGGNVTGASWNSGGLIKEASGKVFFTMAGTRYVCSGAVVTDSRATYSLVLTAGHCTYDETNRAFATNWMFYPDYDESPTSSCANTAYGCWTATALVVHQGYASAGGFNSQATLHDWGFAVVPAGGKSGTQLDAAVGSFPIAFSSVGDGTRAYAFGYPAAQKYKGNDLVYCAGPTFSDPYNSQLTYGLTCDMTGGSSGGPWLTSFSEGSGTGTLRSVNSYGYSGVKAMHGPKFNTKTGATYSTANSATTNQVVSGG
ncbi:MAG TPA: hypothetical protein VF071_11230 [Candidatus Limnocylindria bacterium]